MKGLPRSRSRGPALASLLIKRSIKFRKTVAMTDAGAAGAWGTVVLEGIPQGNMVLLGAMLYATLTKGDANIIDAFTGNISLGSAATADATLSGSEVDLIPSTAVATGVAGVSANNRAASTATQNGLVVDATAGTTKFNLNVIVPDASSTANSSFTVEGTLYVAYILLGDD